MKRQPHPSHFYGPSARRILVLAWALLAVVILGLTAAGCADESAASGWGGTVDTPASPLPIAFYPPPIIRDGRIYAVTRDELEIPFVVSAVVGKPTES